MKLDQAELDAAYAKDPKLIAMDRLIAEYKEREYARVAKAKADHAATTAEIRKLRLQRKNISITINHAEQKLHKLRSGFAFQTLLVNHYLRRQAKRRSTIRNNMAKAKLRQECNDSSKDALTWYEQQLKIQPPMANA